MCKNELRVRVVDVRTCNDSTSFPCREEGAPRSVECNVCACTQQPLATTIGISKITVAVFLNVNRSTCVPAESIQQFSHTEVGDRNPFDPCYTSRNGSPCGPKLTSNRIWAIVLTGQGPTFQLASGLFLLSPFLLPSSKSPVNVFRWLFTSCET